MIIFQCSIYCLFYNAVNIKWSLCPNEEAVFFLNDATDFEYYYEKKKESGLFRNVFLLMNRKLSFDSFEYSKSKKIRISRRQNRFLNIDKLKGHFSVFCIFVDESYKYLSSMYFFKKKKNLKIHLIEEGFFIDKRINTDIDLMNRIADTVGKKNITIEIHPGNEFNRFSPRGYNTLPQNKFPCEASLLLHLVKDKVFLSFFSTASLNPSIVIHCSMNMILVYQIILIGECLPIKQSAFFSSKRDLIGKYFKEKEQIFCLGFYWKLNEDLSLMMNKDIA